jgi:hypothetical protein
VENGAGQIIQMLLRYDDSVRAGRGCGIGRTVGTSLKRSSRWGRLVRDCLIAAGTYPVDGRFHHAEHEPLQAGA